MRRIGAIEQADRAAVFSDYLYAQGIANTVERTDAGVGELWVHDEAMLEMARDALDGFREDPGHARYADAGKAADERRREQKRQQVGFKRNLHDRRRVFRSGFWRGVPLTRLLIILSVAATVFGGLGSGSRLEQWLSITKYVATDGGLDFDAALPEVAHGQAPADPDLPACVAGRRRTRDPASAFQYALAARSGRHAGDRAGIGRVAAQGSRDRVVFKCVAVRPWRPCFRRNVRCGIRAAWLYLGAGAAGPDRRALCP